MALSESTDFPTRVDDASGLDIYTLDTGDGEKVQGVALLGPDESQVAKAEDAAHVSGDVGIMALAVRKDTAAALSGADGDYTPLIVDANGRLHAVVTGTITADATGQGDVPITLDSEVVTADVTGQGDVPVTLDGEEVKQTTRTLTTLCDTVSASGDTELVATPGAGNRIVISALVLQNESSDAVTIILKSGSTAKRRILGQNQGDGVEQVFPNGRELRLGENEALNINLSGAYQVGYSIDYWTEST